MLRNCVDCGDPFEVEPGEFWKRLCLPCWRGRKFEETDSTRRVSANPWIQHTRQTATQDENQQLLCNLREVVGRLHRAGALADEFYEQLPRLMQLTHPDKHDGSPASLKATQWLLEMRRSAPALTEVEEVPS